MIIFKLVAGISDDIEASRLVQSPRRFAASTGLKSDAEDIISSMELIIFKESFSEFMTST